MGSETHMEIKIVQPVVKMRPSTERTNQSPSNKKINKQIKISIVKEGLWEKKRHE